MPSRINYSDAERVGVEMNKTAGDVKNMRECVHGCMHACMYVCIYIIIIINQKTSPKIGTSPLVNIYKHTHLNQYQLLTYNNGINVRTSEQCIMFSYHY